MAKAVLAVLRRLGSSTQRESLKYIFEQNRFAVAVLAILIGEIEREHRAV